MSTNGTLTETPNGAGKIQSHVQQAKPRSRQALHTIGSGVAAEHTNSWRLRRVAEEDADGDDRKP